MPWLVGKESSLNACCRVPTEKIMAGCLEEWKVHVTGR